MAILLGIDTGGTYTDAALYDDTSGEILAAEKALTTRADLSLGVAAALDSALASGTPEINLVSLSTTLATNALVEGQGAPVGLILIGQGPAALARAGLGEALGGAPSVFLSGGHNAAGEPVAPLDLDTLQASVEGLAARVDGFAVAGEFATRNPAHEIAARDCLRELTGLPVSCSHELSSRLDAPRRALTTLLNARLIPLLNRLILSVRGLMEARGLTAPLMVVKGDGSLISSDMALLRPVETILSGPAARVIGARHLSGERDCFVADIGGTTTDIALLRDGEPVLSAEGATVGGWRTMVEAVAVRAVGLGGDSEVRALDGRLELGPRRVLPLCLLEQERPEILAILEEHLGRAEPKPDDGAFAVPALDHSRARQGFTRAEAALWEELQDGPLPLVKIETLTLKRRALERLRWRGAVLLAGFTPSDAAHLLGIQTHWPGKASALAARLWMRRLALAGILSDSAEAFAQAVVEQAVRQSAAAVCAAALSEEAPPQELEQGVLLRRALEGPVEGALLGASISLNRPLVAVGAPAATFYPAVGKRLNTRVALPPSGPVCNAVGAVASGVTQRVRASITQPAEGVFRLHHAEGVRDFRDIEDAASAGIAAASDLARRRASLAGVANAELRVSRLDNVAEGVNGGPAIFLESEILAIAAGRPILGKRGASPHRAKPQP